MSGIVPGDVDDRGLTLLTETQFILRHVEVVLRAHLDHFLGVQEAEDWIARATADAQILEDARAALDNPTARLLFARALRTLAGEGVALTNPKAIVEGAQAARWSNVFDIVDKMRVRVKAQLPGMTRPRCCSKCPMSGVDLPLASRRTSRIKCCWPSASGCVRIPRRSASSHTTPTCVRSCAV